MADRREMQAVSERAKDEEHFSSESSLVLKRLLLERQMTYADLAAKLQACGYDETEISVSHKVRRGKYQLGFLFEVMNALGVDVLSLSVPDWARSHRPAPESAHAN
ncbi:hypothetical protein B0G80_5919 [Paraburkholderia sp. BL6669N2]|uniref:DUF6471 domain-containing protein n=1 Tax=Paraburkholderia sp. BL6669N2 TaxID=1938807 RepID=UPI000E3880B0|nr:DUF6471 domain-containing protein [Paraburkholderia sp. BL6669N2]REG49545.1 hypothetical protein B0G80_5919 [Paraburkholderia sp. BL6669N2]